MSTIRHHHRDLDVACRLGAADAAARAVQWQRLREGAGLGSEAIPGGARLWLRAEAAADAEALARQESGCCGFLDLELGLVDDRLRLDITSPAPDAGPVIACLAGLDPGCPLPCR